MPDLPVVDAHVHLWDPRRFRMPWLDDNALLRRSFDLTDFSRDGDGIGVQALVYVEVDVRPAYGLIEARWAAVVVAKVPLLATSLPP